MCGEKDVDTSTKPARQAIYHRVCYLNTGLPTRLFLHQCIPGIRSALSWGFLAVHVQQSMTIGGPWEIEDRHRCCHCYHLLPDWLVVVVARWKDALRFSQIYAWQLRNHPIRWVEAITHQTHRLRCPSRHTNKSAHTRRCPLPSSPNTVPNQ
jgi:hypothetical protein